MADTADTLTVSRVSQPTSRYVYGSSSSAAKTYRPQQQAHYEYYSSGYPRSNGSSAGRCSSSEVYAFSESSSSWHREQQSLGPRLGEMLIGALFRLMMRCACSPAVSFLLRVPGSTFSPTRTPRHARRSPSSLPVSRRSESPVPRPHRCSTICPGDHSQRAIMPLCTRPLHARRLRDRAHATRHLARPGLSCISSWTAAAPAPLPVGYCPSRRASTSRARPSVAHYTVSYHMLPYRIPTLLPNPDLHTSSRSSCRPLASALNLSTF